MKTSLLSAIAVAGLGISSAFAQTPAPAAPAAPGGVPSSETAQLLSMLKQLREQQQQQLRSTRANAVSMVQRVLASPASMADAWSEGVRLTRFDGIQNETEAFRGWKDGEGSVFNEKEVQNALRLHFAWFSITMQRQNGAKVADLLNIILNHANQVIADEVAMDEFTEDMNKHRAMANSGRFGKQPASRQDDGRTKNVHDQILKTAVNSSPWAQINRFNHIFDLDGWPMVPGDYRQIYEQIIQPEYLARKDPRITDYFDFQIKMADQRIEREKRTFSKAQFNTVVKPDLMFKRAIALQQIGQSDRALKDMISLIKAHPTHPAFGSWTMTLEKIVNPPPVAPPEPAPAAN